MAMSTLTGQGAWRTKPYAVSPMPQAVIDAALGTFSMPSERRDRRCPGPGMTTSPNYGEPFDV